MSSTSISLPKLALIFTACLALCSIPSMFFIFILLTGLALMAFFIICVADYINKSSLRRNAGLVLSMMIVALIVSLLFYYISGKLNGF